MDIKNQYTGEIILSIGRLRGADLARANLARADFSDANLAGANLARADLSDANLARANLARANLARADLSDAYLAGTNLIRANLARADLSDADLTGADLTGADLRGATGNMREVHSMQSDPWRVVWWMSGNTPMLAIGCKMYPTEQWWNFTDERIAAMDRKALSWWRKWKAPLHLIVTELAPATPKGWNNHETA